jgi:uncharacterized membrane protein
LVALCLIISGLKQQYQTIFLQTVLDVHEEFQSIPEDVIKQARKDLSIDVNVSLTVRGISCEKSSGLNF